MFLRDVKLSSALALGTLLSKSRHELVKVGLELLLDTIWPVIFTVKLWNIDTIHFV